ncbi:MAG: NAD-dependent epimerase/dehydratase family protein [Cocleimonas sp.]
MSNILLTGYTGFVGRHLTQLLVNENNLTFLGRKKNNIGKYFKASIDECSDYQSALSGIDVVIHCAARVHVMGNIASDAITEYRNINTFGTLNLARQAADSGVKRFIFLSTIKVNGESTTGKKPFSVKDSINATDPYGISKAEAELQLLTLSNSSGMEVVIIRPPLVYGEGVKANFAKLLSFVSKGYPLPFRSIIQNKRSLISVYNLVDLIKVCVTHPAAANQVFLASDDHDISTAEMVALMVRVQGKANFLFPVPVFIYKLMGGILKKENAVDRLIGCLQIDLSHTKNTLNWQPPYSIEHGFTLAAKSRND